MAAKLKKGDKVRVLAGKDKGKDGEISRVLPKEGKAVVDGINIAIRHQRQTQSSQGGRIRRPSRSSFRTWRLWMPTAKPRAWALRSKTARKCVSPKSTGDVIDA